MGQVIIKKILIGIITMTIGASSVGIGMYIDFHPNASLFQYSGKITKHVMHSTEAHSKSAKIQNRSALLSNMSTIRRQYIGQNGITNIAYNDSDNLLQIYLSNNHTQQDIVNAEQLGQNLKTSNHDDGLTVQVK